MKPQDSDFLKASVFAKSRFLDISEVRIEFSCDLMPHEASRQSIWLDFMTSLIAQKKFLFWDVRKRWVINQNNCSVLERTFLRYFRIPNFDKFFMRLEICRVGIMRRIRFERFYNSFLLLRNMAWPLSRSEISLSDIWRIPVLFLPCQIIIIYLSMEKVVGWSDSRNSWVIQNVYQSVRLVIANN